MNLRDRLTELFPTAKRQTLKRMVENGQVTVNGRLARRLKDPIGETDKVHVLSKSKPVVEIPFDIVFEDRDILVIDKPAGLLTSTVPRERRPTALAMVRQYIAQTDPKASVGLIHRLDREASGLLVFSRTAAAFQSLKRQFFDHSAGRIYLAVVSPPPKSDKGKIESNLAERTDGSVHSVRNGGQHAVTEYEVLRTEAGVAVVRVKLQTGRKHQIRAHLSEKGSPIVGDTMYGGKENANGLMLAAIELELDHPQTGRRMTFRLSTPARFGKRTKNGSPPVPDYRD